MGDGNIVVCPTCRARMISEDRLTHECDEGYRIEEGILWVRSKSGDWQSIKLSTETLQEKNRKDSADDLPAPAFGMFFYEIIIQV